jgi:hypothetical protein
MLAFNAIEELLKCREWLRSLRGEVDAGLHRLDVLLKDVAGFGPVQGRRVMGGAPKPKPIWSTESRGKINFIPKASSVGLGLGPKECGQSKRPKSIGAIPPVGLGLKVGSAGPSGKGLLLSYGISTRPILEGPRGLLSGAPVGSTGKSIAGPIGVEEAGLSGHAKGHLGKSTSDMGVGASVGSRLSGFGAPTGSNSEWGGWCSRVIPGPHGVGLWKYICQGWQVFRSHFRFDPGEGSRIRFWEDIWCGDRTLKEAFPNFFNMASFKGASIANNLERYNGIIQWNIQFSRLSHDWEVEVLASFYKCLYDCKLRGVGADKLWWLHSRKGVFEVKSFYRALSPSRSSSFPWKSIWRTKAPHRVAFLAWTAALGKILTVDNLRRKGMVVVNRCGLCEADEESVDHLLLHCGTARVLWNAFFARFGFCWVMPSSVKELLAS